MEKQELAKLRCEIATKVFCTQSSQIKFWKADDCDLVKLSHICVRIADDILEWSEIIPDGDEE